MSFIELKKICKKYPNAARNSVTDFSLEIGEKEFIAFVEPSGCGKSITLRMIAGFENITGGELYIDGRLSPATEVLRWFFRTTRFIRI